MEGDCPKLAWRIYKKLDRVRLVTLNNWCKKVDESAKFCSWAHKDWQGNVINYRQKDFFHQKFGVHLKKEESQYLD